MNDRQSQGTLFVSQPPSWTVLPEDVQQAIVEVLAQMLVQLVAEDSQPHSEQENNHEQ